DRWIDDPDAEQDERRAKEDRRHRVTAEALFGAAERSPLDRRLRSDGRAAGHAGYFLNAFAAADSSAEAVPLMLLGFLRKSWKIFQSACPVVAAKAGGSRSDRSKRVAFDWMKASADALCSGSL